MARGYHVAFKKTGYGKNLELKFIELQRWNKYENKTQKFKMKSQWLSNGLVLKKLPKEVQDMCFIKFKGTTNGSKTKDLKIKCSLIIFKETILVKK